MINPIKPNTSLWISLPHILAY